MVQLVQEKIAIVVGAGASKEFGLPTGKELCERIINLLEVRESGLDSTFVDSEFGRAVRIGLRGGNFVGRTQDIYRAAKLIRENLSIAPSIDNFLHTHRSNSDLVFLGKLAIVFCLLRAEASSSLAVDPSNIYNRLELGRVGQSWLGQLFTQLAVAGDFSDFLNRLSSVFFLSFNYDRCIQQFFAFAARQYFDLDDESVGKLVAKLNIHYIYGSIGDFQILSGNRTTFGFRPEAENCLNLVGKIQTFTEGRESDDSMKLSEYLDGAREIYFLGFGFNKLNLKRLFPSGSISGRSVFATTKGLPEMAASQIAVDLEGFIRKSLLNGIGERIQYEPAKMTFKNVTCSNLIWECQRNFQTMPS